MAHAFFIYQIRNRNDYKTQGYEDAVRPLSNKCEIYSYRDALILKNVDVSHIKCQSYFRTCFEAINWIYRYLWWTKKKRGWFLCRSHPHLIWNPTTDFLISDTREEKLDSFFPFVEKKIKSIIFSTWKTKTAKRKRIKKRSIQNLFYDFARFVSNQKNINILSTEKHFDAIGKKWK